jgi:peptidoglycan/LPS O-acetylase OafA/YrhL
MNIQKPRLIDNYSSIILDILRILAAAIVLIFHIAGHWSITNNSITKMSRAPHGGVVIFFVLSGFVIAYTAIQRNRGGMQYFQARFSRLYSIVIPALVITGIIQVAVYYLDKDLYLGFARGLSLPRYILSGLFVNEIWFFSAGPPINGPLWSLSYEFWYYIIFGLFLYKRKGRKWLIPGIIGCLIPGPKILLMMPIWLFGYLAYRIPRPNITISQSWVMFSILTIASFISIFYIQPLPYKIGGDQPLTFAGQFLTDWITGIFIALALWIIPPYEGKVKWVALTKWIRNIADLTFPIYILHFPFIVLYDALTSSSINKTSQLWLPLIFILTVTILIGIVLERFRPYWTKFFSYLFTKIAAIRTKFNHKPIKDPSIVPSIK